MPHSAARRLYVPETAHVAQTFLADLRDAHRTLLAHIQKLEALSLPAAPDRTAVATARWKLGQASLARRLLAGRICDYFQPRCDPAVAQSLQALREADRDLLRQSAAYLGKWTTETIARDWFGYGRDGQAIRCRVHDQVVLEQRLLYPLLERSAKAL